MKTRKLIMACIVFFIGANILFAGEQNANSQKSAAKTVEKLNSKVTLTESQQAILLKAAKTFFKNRDTAAQKSGDQVQKGRKQAKESYQAVLDSVLTSDQKAILEELKTEKLQEAQNRK